VLLKYIERKRNLGAAKVPRVTMDELKVLLESGHDPLIVDARGVTARQLEEGIPGALVYGDAVPARLMASLDKERHIVIYCSCPNDVTAAQVAKEFVKNGFHRARPCTAASMPGMRLPARRRSMPSSRPRPADSLPRRLCRARLVA
jgi:rhodanese-related sulfurtransferase